MPGAERLRDSAALKELLLAQSAAGKLTAAVCASPAVVLGAHGLLPASATCYPAPAFKDAVALASTWEDSTLVVNGHVISSRSRSSRGSTETTKRRRSPSRCSRPWPEGL